jgi:uncharacterized SAM-binding protein YcdF (DUF218 family)
VTTTEPSRETRERRTSERAFLSRVQRYGTSLLAATGAMFLMVAFTPFANLLAGPLLTTPLAPPMADIIIVLSGGRYDDGSLNEDALERTVAAVSLYYQGSAPRLLFSGGPCCGRSTSALMARLATDLGVPRGIILLEETSADTHDSAISSATLLHRNGARSAILVTSPLHMLRARLTFATVGIIVHPVLASNRKLFLVSSVGERMSLLQSAVHEYLGLAVYRMQGWI